MARTYALMLLKSADLLAVYETKAAAKAGLKKIKGADASLTDLGIVELGDDGRPVSEDDGLPTPDAQSVLYDARIPA